MYIYKPQKVHTERDVRLQDNYTILYIYTYRFFVFTEYKYRLYVLTEYA